MTGDAYSFHFDFKFSAAFEILVKKTLVYIIPYPLKNQKVMS